MKTVCRNYHYVDECLRDTFNVSSEYTYLFIQHQSLNTDESHSIVRTVINIIHSDSLIELAKFEDIAFELIDIDYDTVKYELITL